MPAELGGAVRTPEVLPDFSRVGPTGIRWEHRVLRDAETSERCRCVPEQRALRLEAVLSIEDPFAQP